jgi:ATP-dependent helicase/nuclease subunit A
MMPANDATSAQIQAADPGLSTWVSANAGSGKTRVLTDRVARLLLRETPPQRILCLTYTKAAASHMQIQLFERLGKWAMLPDAELRSNLNELGESSKALSSEDLRRARTLFARALETPGGLKIQTIHSFCAALLRRFPVEAGVSPQFQEMDERSGKRLRADILEALADQADHTAFDGMAAYLSGDDTDKFVQEIAKQRDAFAQSYSRAEIWQKFGLAEGYGASDYLAQVFPEWTAEVLVDLQKALLTGSPRDTGNAAKLSQIIGAQMNMDTAEFLEDMFVFGHSTNQPHTAKLKSFPTKPTRAAHPDLMQAVDHLMLGFETAKPLRQGLAAAQRACALHQFAAAFLPEYANRKQAQGWLDFDDLILKARALLTESGMAQWVLFKMDGGIDHILVDEAQDTSPEQWAVISELAEEFSVGLGARDVERTLFVVGDEKQSIYSFQGADPHAFDRMRQRFDQRLKDAGDMLQRKELLYSFRSSSAILRLVDQVMIDVQSELATTVTHRAFHENLPGRVDLWQFLDRSEKPEKPVWHDPVDTPSVNDPSLALAREIAAQIKSILAAKTVIPSTKGARQVQPGDFLILVQRRSPLFHQIIRALKAAELPVAGADRLRVGAELAVRDLTALMSFLTTPEDDLSLASALRSPLFGFSERDLFHLAHGRKGWLWAVLRNLDDEFPTTLAVLRDLRNQADFLRPYELLERVLTKHKGRENLIARLGREAEEGIDALLGQALDYESIEPPSLTGFLGWMSTDDSDIKRQMDAKSQQIRVMTVHGAKGLESPIVILPDTAKRKPSQSNAILPLADGFPVWKLSEAEAPDTMQAALEAQKTAQMEERMRLLYVAMTRAENWLIVCGAGDRGKDLESWYNRIEAAMVETPAKHFDFAAGQGRRYQSTNWQDEDPVFSEPTQTAEVVLPEWVKSPAPTPPQPLTLLSPSNLGGDKIVAGASVGLDEEAAKRRGGLIHLLFEHLPQVAPKGRMRVSQNLLAGQATKDEQADLLAEVLQTLDNPDLAFLFSPETLAEVGISADFAEARIFGYIDRLVVTPERILAVDFKSNADVPANTAQVPEGILRQMAAYAVGLSEIWPDRRIETAVLWTKPARLMLLPNDLVAAARLDTRTTAASPPLSAT